MKNIAIIIVLILTFLNIKTKAQRAKTGIESDFYRIRTLPIPPEVKLEVGGLAALPNGSVAVSTRRGEIWIVENPYMLNSTTPKYKLFASGLHEILGLAYHEGAFYCTQRGELTKITDTDKDGEADNYEAVVVWPLSGNYHEYSYGPVFDKNGDMYITLNLAWVGYGEGKMAPWRGWTLKVDKKGNIEPFASGQRSPAGFTLNSNGDFFYGENQGDWIGSGRVSHLAKGDFAGNPAGLYWTKEANSPLKLVLEDIPNTGAPMHLAKEKVPALKMPAVWFPHTLMGISTADIIEDQTDGGFGPFAKQYFVADQGHSKIMRMSLEKVKGEYQGACFPFVEGFQSGILRLRWGSDNSIFAGMTSRGWASTGKDEYGLQRLEWTGKMPFEMKTVKATPDGFEIEFTKKVQKTTLQKLLNYEINSFTYMYHSRYGSPIIDNKPVKILQAIVNEDGSKVRLVTEALRPYFIHEIKLKEIISAENDKLLHDFCFYTLNNIPEGEKAKMSHVGHNMPATDNKMPKEETASKTMVIQEKRVNEMPASWGETADQVISIGTMPGLQWDIKTIQINAGDKIKWIFNNNDDMTHNLAILAPGAADAIATAAMNMGLKGSELNYIPKSPKVLFHTGLIQPGESETFYFIAPDKPGNYPFICTYPGHGGVMRGVIKVVK